MTDDAGGRTRAGFRRWVTRWVSGKGREVERASTERARAAMFETLERNDAVPEDFERARADLDAELDHLREAQREVLQAIEEVDRLQKLREYDWRFGEQHFAARRRELAAVLEEDPEQGLRHLLARYCAALAAGEIGECRRLAEADLPFPEVGVVTPSWLKEQTGELVDGDWAAADPLLSLLAEGALDGEPFASGEQQVAMHVLRVRGWMQSGPPERRPEIEQILEVARKLDPSSALPIVVAAELHRSAGELEAARRAAMQAVETDRSAPDGYIEFGAVTLALGHHSEAGSAFERAAELLADRPNPVREADRLERRPEGGLWLALAQQLRGRGDLDGALEAIRRAPSEVQGKGNATAVRWELEAELLAATGADLAEVARARTVAGKHRYWANETAVAEAHFAAGQEGAPDDPEPLWFLMDLGLARLHESTDDAAKRKLLASALEHWDSASELRAPEEDGWPLLTRALLGEYEAELRPRDARALTWQSLIYATRYLSVSSANGSAWSVLARFLRDLDLEDAALRATDEALRHEPANPFVAEERVIALVNRGMLDEARELLAQREGSAWHRAVAGYIGVRSPQQGSLAEGIELLRRSLDEKGEPWAWQALADAASAVAWEAHTAARAEEAAEYRAMAEQSYRQLLHALGDGRCTPDESTWEDIVTIAAAKAFLGATGEAQACLDAVDDARATGSTDFLSAAALIAASRGDTARAAGLLGDAAHAGANVRAIDDVARFAAPACALAALEAEQSEDDCAVLVAKARRAADEARAGWAPRGYEAELAETGDRDELARHGGQLALGWLRAADGRWAAAADAIVECPPKVYPRTTATQADWWWSALAAAEAAADRGAAAAAVTALQHLGVADTMTAVESAGRVELTRRGAASAVPGAIGVASKVIQLEVAADLLPVGANWADDHPLFTEYLPAARERMLHDLGWPLPAVNVRVVPELGGNGWQVTLHGTIVAAGEAWREKWFVPGAARRAADGADAESGEQQSWVDRKPRWREAWDHYEYLVRQTERAVRSRLGQVVDPQGVVDWLRRMESRPPEGVDLVRLTDVVRLLLGDEVPVADVAAVLDAVATHADTLDEPAILAERVRAAIGYQLDESELAVFRLDNEFERLLEECVHVENGGKLALRASRSEALRIVLGLQSWINGLDDPAGTVLVTGVAKARPVMSDLLDVLQSALRVVTVDEGGRLAVDEAQLVPLWDQDVSEEAIAELVGAALPIDDSLDGLLGQVTSTGLYFGALTSDAAVARLLAGQPVEGSERELATNRALGLHGVGRIDDAAALWRALATGAEQAETVAMLAMTLHWMGDLGGAVDAYSRLSLDRLDADSLLLMAEAALRAGRVELAERSLDPELPAFEGLAEVPATRAALLREIVEKTAHAG